MKMVKATHSGNHKNCWFRAVFRPFKITVFVLTQAEQGKLELIN